MKEFLRELGVPFEARNVLIDPAARAEFLAAGFKTPPVTVIDGVAVWGYQPERLEALIFGETLEDR
ncbi:MAG: glutaredoxin family protein [Dehalococcoidia bacterium]|nr:glutaredoxin family protein [Dehalococcoidia bacterium]